jgi:hypothetical protein
METVDPKEFTSRMSRVATVSADDFRPMDYGKPWDGELYWGMFLWELGLLDREPKRQYIPELHLQFGTDDENPNFNEHHFGLYDRDWEKVKNTRSVQVVPVEPVSARGMAYLDRGIFKPEAWERIVNHLLEVPGSKRVAVSLANVAESVVEALLENDALDPKAFSIRAHTVYDPSKIVLDAYSRILSLPHEGEAKHTFYPQTDRIIREMIAKLEQATGRQALSGTDGYLRNLAPMPWNQANPNQTSLNAKFVREIVSTFNACSKAVKR